jgi:AmmeMemoRadiSam system protein B
MDSIRAPAVAGLFYPARADALAADVARLIGERPARCPRPKALIAPHAGYLYSGETAGAAYRRLAPWSNAVERVVLLGPSHRVHLRGIATSGADSFSTPLGTVPVDADLTARAESSPQVHRDMNAHAAEHSLEVHLPFLQVVLGAFSVLPLLVGDADPETVAGVIEACWGGPATLLVASTDLSHYLRDDQARERDARTCASIERLDGKLEPDEACGCRVVNGLMLAATRRGLRIETLDLRNSGDACGDRSRVVGYGAWALYQAESELTTGDVH